MAVILGYPFICHTGNFWGFPLYEFSFSWITSPYADHKEGNPRTETQRAWISERGSQKIFLTAFIFHGIREGKRVDIRGGNVVTSCLF